MTVINEVIKPGVIVLKDKIGETKPTLSVIRVTNPTAQSLIATSSGTGE